MRKNRFFAIFIFVTFCLVIWNCDKNTEKENVDSLTKDFLCFKNGSSWLYQEDSIGITQYLYVDQYSDTLIKKEIDSNQYLDETIRLNIASKDSSICTQKITFSWFGITEKFGNSYNVYCSINNTNGISFQTENLHSFKVFDVTYNNVCHLVFSYNNEYWIAKNKWIIKKIIRTPKGNWYWSLKECHIVQ